MSLSGSVHFYYAFRIEVDGVDKSSLMLNCPARGIDQLFPIL